jgi:hypothetical protein
MDIVGFAEHYGSGIALRGMNCTRFGGLGLDTFFRDKPPHWLTQLYRPKAEHEIVLSLNCVFPA